VTRTAPARGLLEKAAVTLQMIKVAHSVFALPFGLSALFLAARGWPGARLLLLVVLAMVSARAAAMTFNRLADADLDARNPRTRERALPTGRLTRGFSAGFTLLCCAAFVACAAAINRLCGWLSPVALAVVLGYSYAKRFTALCHLWLGAGLALAPLGAWVAVKGAVDASAWIPGALAIAVLFWVAGFDLIYACQDVDFDRREGLQSLPARLGARRALRLASAFHAVTVAALGVAGRLAGLSWKWGLAVAAVGALLVVEHWIADPADARRLEQAFFPVNAAIGPLLFLAVLAELYA
jgi:4-hydroxybenzoate polyprenyltransferase